MFRSVLHRMFLLLLLSGTACEGQDTWKVVDSGWLDTGTEHTSGETDQIVQDQTGNTKDKTSQDLEDAQAAETWPVDGNVEDAIEVLPDIPDPSDVTDITPEWLLPDSVDTTSELVEDTQEDTEEPPEDIQTDLDATLPDVVEPPPPVFDLALIGNSSSANCSFTNQRVGWKGTTMLTVWDVSYTSWESIDGTLQPIVIRGYAAKPAVSLSDRPGIVIAHGLGGHATQDSVETMAERFSAFAIAYTGPGGGTTASNTSTGFSSGHQNGYRMFDVLSDVRGSWFWGHSVAGMRAVTCLHTRSDVDKNRIGMTGYSAGAVATLIAAGVDARIKAAVPLSGTLAWDVATQAPKAWQHTLLAQAGLSIASPEWQILMNELVSPVVALGNTTVPILMVNGSTDEFFPLTAHQATLQAIPGTTKRTSIVANFDHGCYSLTGMESAATIEERAQFRSDGGQNLWFGRYFNLNNDWQYVPQTPTVTVTPSGAMTMIFAVVDPGGSKLKISKVQAWFSNDAGAVYGSVQLNPVEDTNNMYFLMAPFTSQPNTVVFVDVTYKKSSLFGSDVFSLSSLPVMSPSFVPHIRDINTCL
jgi:cephalosporin-C deacetylase-like acetyl esterase